MEQATIKRLEGSSSATTLLVNTPKLSRLDRLAKSTVLVLLGSIKHGHLTLEDGDAVYQFGQPLDTATVVGKVRILDPSVYRDLISNSTVGAGESYMKDNWSTPDLVSVIRVLALNLDTVLQMDNKRSWLSRLGSVVHHVRRTNSVKGAQKNISVHYDLSNTFFSLMLDDSMMYSSAIFPHKDATLYEASVHKLDVVCKQLSLMPTDTLLEIGTGWGGLAIHAAQHYGCHVTTTTISDAQYTYALEKVKRLGLTDRITVLKQDYRLLDGQYDKLVSIEMIEAVGHNFYDQYFSKCASLLKPDGLMMIQAITIADQRFHAAKNAVDFIQRYIFPGGCLPSHAVISDCIARVTDMQIIHFENITSHYAETLKHWREAFFHQLNAIKALGFSDQFCRMWEFYLCYCEAGFRERSIGTAHFLFAKPQYRYINS